MNMTIGNCIDQLTVCNLAIWKMEDLKRDPDASDTIIANATRQTNILNLKRNHLIEAIDLGLNEIAKGKQQELFGQGSTKNYGK